MKAIITLLVAAAASSAFGITVERFEENLGGIGLHNACLTATEIKSIRGQEVCAVALVPKQVSEGDNAYTEWSCPQKTIAQISYPRTTQVSYCKKYSDHGDGIACSEFGTKPRTVGHQIKVQKEVDGFGEGGPQLSFYVKTLPSCQ